MIDTMTDGPTNEPPGEPAGAPTGGPPWTGPPGPFAGIQRVEGERWIAGVAAGVARHLGIETWIVRTLALGLAIIGIGIPLYILGWLLLPSDTRPSIASERQWNRNTVFAVCALVVVGSLALVGPGDVATPWRALPWVVVGLGVLLLVRPGGSTTAPPFAMPGNAGPPPSPTPPPPPPPYPTAPMAPIPPQPPLPPEPRKVSLLTPLTLFGLLALAGLAVVVGADGIARPGVVAALSLCLIGAVVLMSSVVGRARGLMVVGVLVAIPLVVGLAAGSRWGDWRNRTYRPISATPIERSYERGVGRTVLDLRELRLPEERTARIELEQLAGEIVVWLPHDATTELSAEVVAGEIEISDGIRDEGMGAVVERNLITGTGRGDLDLQLDLVAGQIDVRWDDPPIGSSTTTTTVPDATSTVPAPVAPTTAVPFVPTAPTLPGAPR